MVSPCVAEFRLERLLPSMVMGPVDFFALARLARVRLERDIA